MTTVPEKVLNWLYSVLTSEYRDVQRTYSDVAEALSNYPSVSPRTEVYTYENGSSALLLLLSGTLPVTFRGTVYRFPVALWVPYGYPHECPIIYVTPSQEMMVRPGQHVGGDGRVYHPYLAQWGTYWDKSTLLDFLAVLRGVFAKEPPLISKQQAQYGPPKSAQPVPPPVPPPPEEFRRPAQASSVMSTPQQPKPPPKPPKPYDNQTLNAQTSRSFAPPQAPTRPPKPPQSTQTSPIATYNQSNSAPWQQPPLNYPPSQQDGRYFQQGPRPSLDSALAQSLHRKSYDSPVSPLTPTNGNKQQSYSRYQQPAPLPQQPSFMPYQQPLSQRSVQGSSGYPTQSAPSSSYPPNYQHQGYGPPQSQPPPKPKSVVPDIMDSPMDVTLPSQSGTLPSFAAPPIPPNPEKDALLNALRSAFYAQASQTIASNTAAIAPLQAQQEALRTAHARLQTELSELQILDAALASNEQILVEAMREADRVMEEAKRRKVPDVDEVLVAPTVVGGQLYNLCAEERALGDALFILGRALDKGRVSSDVFVKQTRALAREQFLKKALIKKIATGMGLEEHSISGR